MVNHLNHGFTTAMQIQLLFFSNEQKKMISLTNRWKVCSKIGKEAEYKVFVLSTGFEKDYLRRYRRALWQLKNKLDGDLGTFPEVGIFVSLEKKPKAQQSSDESLVICGKCRNKPNAQNSFKPQGVVIQQRQTRSADEGMTSYFTCLDCGHKWVG